MMPLKPKNLGLARIGCLAAWALVWCGASAGAQTLEETRRSCAQAALDAIELQDRTRLEPALDRLDQLSGQDPIAQYLHGRLAEQDGAWQRAMLAYQAVLTGPGLLDEDQWIQLAAGRLVRARQIFQETQVHELLRAESPPEPARGRLLVIPPEPIMMEEDPAGRETELEAVGISIASWVVGSLAQVPGTRPVDLHVTFLLSSSLGPQGEVGFTPTERPQESLPQAPPINTILGVAHRLANLSPTGPPPGAPEAPVPARYLNQTPAGKWSDALAQALSHFQSEYDLPPSGMLDPASRQALQQAFREAALRPQLPTPTPSQRSLTYVDPGQGLGTLLGAEAVLSGTLEPLSGGQVRWNLAWVSPDEGSLLSPPLAGVLTPGQFQASWTQMIRQILLYSPACENRAACEGIELPPPPTSTGARAYGEAMLAIEAEAYGPGASLFQQAAGEGAGDRAAWYGMAWKLSVDELSTLEQRLLSRIAHGVPRVPAGQLLRVSRSLAGGLIRPGSGQPSRSAWTGGDALSYFPEDSWIRIAGTVEGP